MIKDLHNQNTIHKVFGCVLVIFSKVLYMPMLEFSLRAFKAYSRYDLGISIGLSVLNVFSILFYFMIIFYTRRIYKLCMLSDQVPWSNSNSKAIYFGFIAKVLNPVILGLDTSGTYIYAEVICSFIVQVLYLFMTLFFADIYHKKSDLLQKFFQGSVVLILQIGVIKYLIKDYDSKEFILFFCIIAFFLYFIYQINHWRKERILELFNSGHLKLELEYEYLLLYLQELVKEAMVDSVASQEYYSEILKLLELHQLQCYDNDCICNRQQEFLDIFKQGQRQATNVFLVEKSQLKKIKQYISSKSGLWFSSTINRVKEDGFSQKYAKKVVEDELSLLNVEDDESSQQSKNNNSNLNNLQKQQQQKPQKIQQDGAMPAEGGVSGKNKNNQPEIQKERKAVKIEVQYIKHRFLSNFILIFFNDVKAKFPMSLKIHILCNYYSMFIAKRPQLCISQLRQFSDKNMSWLDKVSKYVNEFYILHEYERVENQNSLDISQARVDGEHFIKINDLYDNFHSQVDQMSYDAVEFWKGFVNDDVDPYKQYDTGEKIADSIRNTYQTFKQIEDNLIQKDFKIYVWFAQIQLKIMNDLDGYHIFMQKMRGVMQMNKMFQSNIKSKLMNEDSGFIVTDGHVQSNGKILFINKILKRWLLQEDEQAKFLNINSLLPKLVSEKHDEFMKRYNKTGDSVLLGRKFIAFMIDKNHSLFPIEIVVKFHYSQKFQYSYIAFVNIIKEMMPFRDMLKYKNDQLVFMTIDLYDGQINEVSKNFMGMLEMAGINQYKDVQEISFTEKKRCIGDVLKNFNFDEIKQLTKVKGPGREFYDASHFLDLSSFSDNLDLYNNTYEELNAKVSIFVESYGQGKLDIGYVVISINQVQSINLDEKSEDTQFKEQQQIFEEKYSLPYEDSGSAGSSSAGSSNSSTTSSYHAMQQFHSFYKQQTPRILKIVIQLILFMFLVSITIATVNLVLNIQSHNNSELEVRQVRGSMDRVNFSGSIRVLLRSMMNIANGYEQNQSKVLSDRYKSYQDMLRDKTDQLVKTQYYLDNSGYSYSDNFENELSKSQITMTYLMENNQLKQENVTLRNMQSLFTSRLVQAQDYLQNQMKGNIYLQSLRANKSLSYRPTTEEQTLYFIVFNGNSVVRQFNRLFADMYIKDSVSNSESSEEQALITTIISVLTIFLVTCVISPIISKTEERKYNALAFFLRISREEIDFYILNCQECEKLDITSSQRKQNEKNALQFNNLDDMKSMDYASMVYNDEFLDGISDLRMLQESSMLDSSQKRLMGQDTTIRKDNNTSANQNFNASNNSKNITNLAHQVNSIVENQEEQAQEILRIAKKNKIARQNNHLQISQNANSESDYSSHHSSSQVSSVNNKDNKSYLSINQDSMKGTRLKNGSKKAPEDPAQIEANKMKEEILERNLVKIQAIAFRKKTITFMFVMILMIVFSVYFIISYFMAIKNYQTAANSSQDLGIIFSKEQCFENLISYLRENQIRNESLTLPDNDMHASQYFLQSCSAQEQQYKELRKNVPEYFQNAKQYIQEIETEKYCVVVFQNGYQHLQSPCKKALNGLLLKGMTNTLFFMLSHSQKLELAFNTALSMKRRNETFLRAELSNNDTIELIDAKMYIMGQSFIELENQCMDSALKYFKKLLTEFIAVYTVFLALLIGSMVYFTIFAFKRLRKSMWSTNMLLKIIPKQALNKSESEKLKQFFVN
eukprot:403366205